MFGSNNGETMKKLETIYLIISRAFNAFFKMIQELYNHD